MDRSMEDTIRLAIDTHKAMVGQLEKKGISVIAKAAVAMADNAGLAKSGTQDHGQNAWQPR